MTFFPLVTGRDFILSQPLGRESHFITIARELTKVSDLETMSLMINVPPGHGKSIMLCFWIAWTLSRWPNSQYLYISYGHDLASKHTAFIKRIVESSYYRDVFDVHIRHDSKAKDFFQTTSGGSIRAFGSSGAITGQDAGLPGLEEFSGAVVIDDATKPDEASSATIRESILRNYQETILQRLRGPNVPILCIAQRLHEDDLCAFMMSGKDERQWKQVILKSIDDSGNALYPEVNPIEMLREKQEKSPYVFASQYQQDPIPAGGALFKREFFPLLDDEPKIYATFITADTAETNKTYNDATAFGFWGIYKLDNGQTALHCLDIVELFVEPKDLEYEFKSFYTDCLRHPVKPLIAAIEKKSTGVTLLSVLSDMRGMRIQEVKRTAASGSKTERFLQMQPFLASRFLSLPAMGKHTELFIQHMMKITANDTHRRDDMADTAYDAVKIALIDKMIFVSDNDDREDSLKGLFAGVNQNINAARHFGTDWRS